MALIRINRIFSNYRFLLNCEAYLVAILLLILFQANEYLGSGDSADRKMLIKKKADWAVKINEPRYNGYGVLY